MKSPMSMADASASKVEEALQDRPQCSESTIRARSGRLGAPDGRDKDTTMADDWKFISVLKLGWSFA